MFLQLQRKYSRSCIRFFHIFNFECHSQNRHKHHRTFLVVFSVSIFFYFPCLCIIGRA
uniref:Uncharacterized protein n=1 Tax=Arundo donax TaxID=35708 RepID=A0A0A9FXJ2_ARUDO